MDFSEKWGTSIDEAVELALADLKVSRDEVEVTVLEQPTKGFFGIGSKLAKVRVELKKPEPAPEPAPAPVAKQERKPEKKERPERNGNKKPA
ncbi:MAG: protein jag, partial [Clostridiales bacterium]|nr:protein jag [Clostridiales bacterium]